MLNKRALILLLIIAAMIFISSCSGPSMLNAPTCFDNNDCASGYACKKGICTETTEKEKPITVKNTQQVNVEKTQGAAAQPSLATTQGRRRTAVPPATTSAAQQQRGRAAPASAAQGFDQGYTQQTSGAISEQEQSFDEQQTRVPPTPAQERTSPTEYSGRPQQQESVDDQHENDVIVKKYYITQIITPEEQQKIQAEEQAAEKTQEIIEPECSTTKPCKEGYVCDKEVCIEDKTPAPECSATKPCKEGYVCDKEVCIEDKTSTNKVILNLPFEEGSASTTTPDVSGLGNNAQVFGAVWNPKGGYDEKGAYDFDGKSYITVKHTTTLNMGKNDFSYTLWFKTTDAGHDQGLFAKDYHPTSPTAVILTGGKIYLILRKEYPKYAYEFLDTVAVNDGAWHQLAVILEGTTWKYYLDGQLRSTTIVESVDYSNGYNIIIGARRTNDIFFKGSIDSVEIYDSALTDVDVKNMYITEYAKIPQEQAPEPILQPKLLLDANFEDPLPEGTTIQAAVKTKGYDEKTAYSFDGINSYILLPSSTLSQTNDVTLTAWVKTSDAGTGYRGIVQRGNAYGIYFLNNVLGVYDNKESVFKSANVNLADNNWHFIVVSVKSGITDGTKMYVDGKLTTTTTQTVVSWGPAYIGQGQGGAGQRFKGVIDDVKVYNSILTQDQIVSAYASMAPK